MATVSFWARIDQQNAANPELNVANNAAVLLTFDSGATGDLVLDPNGGLPDPDTTVSVGGVSYTFTVDLAGTLPLGSNKVPDAIEGKEVYRITIDTNGATAGGEIHYFFIVEMVNGVPTTTQVQMNGIGNGSLRLDNVTIPPPPVMVCFCAGTMIATPSGARRVDALVAGDMVLNDRGEAKQVLWVGCSRVSLAELRADPGLRSIRIAADAIAPGCPNADLDVSPQHRVVLEGAAAELLFAEARVLVPAKHLVGTLAQVVSPEAEVEYYHVLLDDHDMLISNGLASESFQPARRTMDAMSAANRVLLEQTLEALGMTAMLDRKDAMRSLKRPEALALANSWDASPPPAAIPARGQDGRHGVAA